MKKKFVVSALFVLMFLVSESAIAKESYLGEVSTSYLKQEGDIDGELDLYTLTGTIHFSKVNTSDHPLAEAAFLERVGKVDVTLWDFKYDENTYESEGNYLFVDAAYMKAGFPLAFYANLAQGSIESKDKTIPTKMDTDVTIYGTGLGWFIINGLEVGLSYEKWKYEFDNFSVEPTNTIKKIYTKYVQELPSQMAFNLEGYAGESEYDYDNSFSENEKNEIYGIGGDFYITRKISVGAAFELNKGDDKSAEGSFTTVDFNMFITNWIGFGVQTQKFDAENSDGEDEDTLGGYLKVRF